MIDEIQEIIAAYNKVVKGIETKAKKDTEGRAYGGIIRAGKGKLVENIDKILIQIAWKKLARIIHTQCHCEPSPFINGRGVAIPIEIPRCTRDDPLGQIASGLGPSQ